MTLDHIKTEARAIAACEALREAVLATLERSDDLRRAGHDKAADAYDIIRARVRTIDLEAIVAESSGRQLEQDELVAFEHAAREQSFNTTRRESGDYYHPITNRARGIWTAAVRWAKEKSHG